MKKILAIFIVFMLLTVTVSAANPFNKIEVSPDTKLIDYTEDQGNNGQPVQYVEDYGIGYTWINDYAYFDDLDFGINGADKATIGFTYGNDTPECIIELYLDAPDGTLLGTYTIGNTGGFSSEFIEDFTIDVDIPSGIHTVYVKWTNDTGSLFYIQFNEAPEVVVEETPEPAETAPESPAAPEAPQTSDTIVILAIVMIISAAAVFVKLRKKVN